MVATTVSWMLHLLKWKHRQRPSSVILGGHVGSTKPSLSFFPQTNKTSRRVELTAPARALAISKLVMACPLRCQPHLSNSWVETWFTAALLIHAFASRSKLKTTWELSCLQWSRWNWIGKLTYVLNCCVFPRKNSNCVAWRFTASVSWGEGRRTPSALRRTAAALAMGKDVRLSGWLCRKTWLRISSNHEALSQSLHVAVAAQVFTFAKRNLREFTFAALWHP